MSSEKSTENNQDKIVWNKRVTLISNNYLTADLFKVFALTYVVMILLMGTIFLSTGEIEALIPMFSIFGIVCLALLVLCFLIMWLIFGNAMNFRFTLDEEGILCEILDRRAKMANNAAIIAGVLGGRLQPTGAGLLAKSQETTFVPWKGLVRIFPVEKNQTIALHNSWRRMIIVYATAENYQQVLDFVNQKVDTLEERKITKIKSPLPKMLANTVLIILASIPLFMEPPYPFEIDIFVPIFLLCFAQTTLWISSIMGYMVLLGSFYTLFMIFLIGFQTQDYGLFEPLLLTNFAALASWEWPSMIIIFIALGYFIWFGFRAIRGKHISMLEADMTGRH